MGTDVIGEVKVRVSIGEVLARYGVKPERSGMSKCPLHSEKTPSLKIYPETNSFYCYGCGQGGDVIRLVALVNNITDIEAARELACDYGLAVDDTPPNKEAQRKRAAVRADMDFVQSFIADMDALFYRLCDEANTGRWVLENCPPRLEPDGSIKILGIYEKYVHLMPMLEYHLDYLMEVLADYQRACKRGDGESIAELLNGMVEIYKEWGCCNGLHGAGRTLAETT